MIKHNLMPHIDCQLMQAYLEASCMQMVQDANDDTWKISWASQ